MKRCEHCGVDMTPRKWEGRSQYARRRFCSNLCKDTAHRTQGACTECGAKAISRQLCPRHYKAWELRQSPEKRQAARARCHAYYHARPFAMWTDEEKRAATKGSVERARRYRAQVADSYVRATYHVPKNAAPVVLEMFRAHILLHRALKERREKQD